MRWQAVALLFAAGRRGELAESEARARHEAMTAVTVRLLGDRVSSGTAWGIARDHGVDLAVAEYQSVTPAAGRGVRGHGGAGQDDGRVGRAAGPPDARPGQLEPAAAGSIAVRTQPARAAHAGPGGVAQQQHGDAHHDAADERHGS